MADLAPRLARDLYPVHLLDVIGASVATALAGLQCAVSQLQAARTERTSGLARLAGARSVSGSAAHGHGRRSRVVLVGPLMLHGRVASVARSCLGISVCLEEVAGNEFCGFCAPVPVGRESIPVLDRPSMPAPMCVTVVPDEYPPLSTTLGSPGRFDAPEFMEAVAAVERAAGDHGKPLGGAAFTREQTTPLICKGHRGLFHGYDVLVLKDQIAAFKTWP